MSPVAKSVFVTTGEKQRYLELAELGGIERNHEKDAFRVATKGAYLQGKLT